MKMRKIELAKNSSKRPLTFSLFLSLRLIILADQKILKEASSLLELAELRSLAPNQQHFLPLIYIVYIIYCYYLLLFLAWMLAYVATLPASSSTR